MNTQRWPFKSKLTNRKWKQTQQNILLWVSQLRPTNWQMAPNAYTHNTRPHDNAYITFLQLERAEREAGRSIHYVNSLVLRRRCSLWPLDRNERASSNCELSAKLKDHGCISVVHALWSCYKFWCVSKVKLKISQRCGIRVNGAWDSDIFMTPFRRPFTHWLLFLTLTKWTMFKYSSYSFLHLFIYYTKIIVIISQPTHHIRI